MDLKRREVREGEEEGEGAAMAKYSPEEDKKKDETAGVAAASGHPYDFQVCGPRNISAPNWTDLTRSSWRDASYKRIAVACFIQAVYLLELDRQEKRTEEDCLAPKWWKPFKYKLSQTLFDERDGSIYGAILKWDHSAALSDFILARPSGAPRAVLALRGNLLKTLTIQRDLEDDFSFLAWESLKGSVRFNGTLEALKSIVDKYGSNNVFIAGHSLGAGFALQVGKAMAKQRVFVECHVFNPPSVSVAMSLSNIKEKTISYWKSLRSVFPSNDNDLVEDEGKAKISRSIPSEIKKWMPHLYVNNSDYICCHYAEPAGADVALEKGRRNDNCHGHVAAKLFVMSKGRQGFLEAHELEQWWSNDMELQLALYHSKLINRQLRSLYTKPPVRS